MEQKHINLITSIKLFRGCQLSLIEEHIIGNGYVRKCSPGEEFSLIDENGNATVGVLLSGRCVIYSSDKDRKALLRFVSPGEAIGVAGLFADAPPHTRIFSCGDHHSELFFFDRRAFESLLDAESDGSARNNLISFLSGKVAFLNSRIDCVTGGSAERRLALFIKSSPSYNSGAINIGMSMKALAEALDIGRASLYRAFDALTHSGAIVRENDTVRIIDKQKLDELC